MDKEELLRRIKPYNRIEMDRYNTSPPITIKDYKDDLEYQLVSDIEVPDIHKVFKEKGVDETTFIHCYTGPATEVFFTPLGKWSFYLNGNAIDTYSDIKLILINGYLYMLSKNPIIFSSLIVVITELNITVTSITNGIVLQEIGSELNLVFDSNFNYNQALTSIANGKVVSIKQKYIRVDAGKNILDTLLNYMETPMHYLYKIELKDVVLVNKNTGLSTDEYNEVISIPMLISLSNNNPDLELYILYNGPTPSEYLANEASTVLDYYDTKYPYLTNSDYLLQNELIRIYDNPANRVLFLNNPDLHPSWEDLLLDKNMDTMTNGEVIENLINYNYDLFMTVYRRKHTVNNIFFYKDVSIVDSTKTRKILPSKIKQSTDHFLKITFPNFRHLNFELYMFGRLYTNKYIEERNHEYTVVYIHLSNLFHYYNITADDLKMLVGMAVLKPTNYSKMNYEILDIDYRGMLAISEEFFSLNKKRLFNNGYIMKNTDYNITPIRPVNMLFMFPKRKFYIDDVILTGYKGTAYNRDLDLHLKVKNFTSDEITDITTNFPINKYIYKNLLYVDYIDRRYTLYAGPTVLVEYIDYVIHSSNCIEFISPIIVYPEDIDKEYVDIYCEYNGKMEERLMEMVNTKSYRYRLFNNKIYTDYLYNTLPDTYPLISFSPEALNNNCPELYNETIYRFNMMVTKYFSTETILMSEMDEYGSEWLEKLRLEFPEFVSIDSTTGDITIFLEVPDGLVIDQLKDMPRMIILPEANPLNIMLYNHVIAAYKLDVEGAGTVSRYVPHNNYKIYYKRLQYNNVVIDPTFTQGDFKYMSTIPTRFVVDNSNL